MKNTDYYVFYHGIVYYLGKHATRGDAYLLADSQGFSGLEIWIMDIDEFNVLKESIPRFDRSGSR